MRPIGSHDGAAGVELRRGINCWNTLGTLEAAAGIEYAVESIIGTTLGFVMTTYGIHAEYLPSSKINEMEEAQIICY
jgi:hypothetical protein